jgi:hypothetical protein
MRNIYIHIGIHKTASTLIQKVLINLQRILRKSNQDLFNDYILEDFKTSSLSYF